MHSTTATARRSVWGLKALHTSTNDRISHHKPTAGTTLPLSGVRMSPAREHAIQQYTPCPWTVCTCNRGFIRCVCAAGRVQSAATGMWRSCLVLVQAGELHLCLELRRICAIYFLFLGVLIVGEGLVCSLLAEVRCIIIGRGSLYYHRLQRTSKAKAMINL
jgi:hypothetical protein